jgi:hypothetical protein
MKKLLSIVFAIFLLNSCTVDQEEQRSYTISVLPIESVVMPVATTTLPAPTTYPIIIKYRNPNSCTRYNGFYYKKELLNRTVGIEVISENGRTCATDNTLVEKTLNFEPLSPGTYTFKFYTGEDANGVNQYNIQTIVVP